MKQRNSKIYWLVFIGVVLLLAVAVFCIWLPYKDKTKAPESNKNSNTGQETIPDLPNEINKETLKSDIKKYGEAINSDPTNAQNYIDKSGAEYLAGDKDAALETVVQGLEVDPTNELLKSRKDILEKDFSANSNIDATRE